MFQMNVEDPQMSFLESLDISPKLQTHILYCQYTLDT